MNRIYRDRGCHVRPIAWLVMAAAIAVLAATSGCAPRPVVHVMTVYDPQYHDWHRWDDKERAAYRRYWQDTHEPFRSYDALQQNEVNDYWTWRHGHPDSASR